MFPEHNRFPAYYDKCSITLSDRHARSYWFFTTQSVLGIGWFVLPMVKQCQDRMQGICHLFCIGMTVWSSQHLATEGSCGWMNFYVLQSFFPCRLKKFNCACGSCTEVQYANGHQNT